jgi:hypothetical protein
MMVTDKELRRRFVMAFDEAIPIAPSLETRVNGALKQEDLRSHAWRGGVLFGLGSGLRLAAALAALLIAITVVTTLLYSARLHQPISPSRPQTPLASPSPSYRFTPSASSRAANWPPGGPVPAVLEGCWQSQKYPNSTTFEVCMGQYSFDFGQGLTTGNVVVNGSEIDFISDICTPDAKFGYDRYHYAITGTTLVLTKFPTPNSSNLPSSAGAWGNCGWKLEGSYTKVAIT